MESTSLTDRASEIRERCLRGEPAPVVLWMALVEDAAGSGPEAAAASAALFRGVVEPLSDRFEPPLCDTYATLFSLALNRIRPEWDAGELEARYRRARRPRHFDGRWPETVFVLSRVTLGADVAVTSIVLDAAKKRFPGSEIFLVGSRKCWELFAADARIRHLPADYRQNGGLTERVAQGVALAEPLSRPNAIVIDPDSRLTQLGLLPVCPEEKYFFFESRGYGRDSADSLSQLTKRWVAETFGVVDAVAYLAPGPPSGLLRTGGITVSLGVGENPAKGMPSEFESELLKGLVKRKLPILVDKGVGGEEARRVELAIAASGAPVGRIETWDGSFADFAVRIAGSRLYVGYDSAGQHVAAAAKVPLVSVFGGYPTPRFLSRWSPSGSAPTAVVDAGTSEWKTVLAQTVAAAGRLLGLR